MPKINWKPQFNKSLKHNLAIVNAHRVLSRKLIFLVKNIRCKFVIKQHLLKVGLGGVRWKELNNIIMSS